MRKLTIILITIFSLCVFTATAHAQPATIQNYEVRISQLLNRYKLPQSMVSECDWEFALVLLDVGKDNKIRNVHVLNAVSEEFQRSFDVLKNQVFYAQDKVAGKKVMVVFSLDRDCGTRMIAPLQVSPSRALTRLMKPLSEQLKKEPKTVVSEYVILYDDGKPIP